MRCQSSNISNPSSWHRPQAVAVIVNELTKKSSIELIRESRVQYATTLFVPTTDREPLPSMTRPGGAVGSRASDTLATESHCVIPSAAPVCS